jgi:hypothetical protein
LYIPGREEARGSVFAGEGAGLLCFYDVRLMGKLTAWPMLPSQMYDFGQSRHSHNACQSGIGAMETLVPVVTFASLCSTHSGKRRNQTGTGNYMILVRLWI